MGCTPTAPNGAFLTGMLNYVDCQAQTIGSSGYHALAAPGSAVSLIMTGVLTLFVAVIGLRMMLGQTPSLFEGVTLAAKLGVVLVLATSWPAFRTLVYDVALLGPAQIASSIDAASDLPGSQSGLVGQLQGIDNQLIELARLGAGKPPNADEIVGPTQPLTPAQQQQQLQHLRSLQERPHWDPAHDAALIGDGRTLFLTGAIAAFATVRLIAGLLLALGPLFALFLLFDTTRGLFEGWLKGLAATILGAIATTTILGAEIGLMGPWLGAVLVERQANTATPSVPVELLVMSLVFALTLLAALVASAWIAQGLHMPKAVRTATAQFLAAVQGRDPQQSSARTDALLPTAQRSRALGVADAVAARQLREATTSSGAFRIAPSLAAASAYTRGTASGGGELATVRYAAGRRTQRRVSALAGRRDTQS